MEISTEINKEKNIRQHTIKGRIDVSKLIDFLKKIHTTPDFDLEIHPAQKLDKWLSFFIQLDTSDVSGLIHSGSGLWRKRVGRELVGG